MPTLSGLLLPVVLATTATLAPLERGEILPPLAGELLTGRAVIVPEATRGRVTLLALGFTRGSSKAVEAYGGRFKQAFGADTTITWLEVPVIGGLAGIAKGMITSGMRGGTPEPDRVHVMTVWGGVREWKRRVGYEKGEWAYLVLLDREGRVRWRGKGAFDESRWKELAEATEAAR